MCDCICSKLQCFSQDNITTSVLGSPIRVSMRRNSQYWLFSTTGFRTITSPKEALSVMRIANAHCKLPFRWTLNNKYLGPCMTWLSTEALNGQGQRGRPPRRSLSCGQSCERQPWMSEDEQPIDVLTGSIRGLLAISADCGPRTAIRDCYSGPSECFDGGLTCLHCP
jgi:hypothetical protein